MNYEQNSGWWRRCGGLCVRAIAWELSIAAVASNPGGPKAARDAKLPTVAELDHGRFLRKAITYAKMIRSHLSLLTVIMAMSAAPAMAQIPAFPGAVGFGALASGGRGGTVYHVTNLNDAGPGSFREAVSQDNHIVVFDVGGYAAPMSTNRTVNAAIKVHSNITIAGETAPGDGFGVMGREVSFSTATNVICRYVRFRQGMLDGHRAGNTVGMWHASNLILDHVSIAFGQWNNIDAVGATNITVQNCLIADPVGQRFNAHTEGGPFCWYRNLWANAHNRQPMARADTVWVNNLVYNYEAGYTTTTHAPFHHDLVNNYFIAGPATSRPPNCFFQVNTDQLFYVAGNLLDANKDGKLNGSPVTPGQSVTYGKAPGFTETTKLPTISAKAAVPGLLSGAGCSLRRDALDWRTIGEVASFGKAGFIWTNQIQSGLANCGYGNLNGGAAPLDSDQDGMPDYWEKTLGGNPSADDHNTEVPDQDGFISEPTFFPPHTPVGYTRLDEYLYFLGMPHFLVVKNTATKPSRVQIDLRKFTSGFTTAPGFEISGVSGGMVSQSGDGGCLITFTPARDFVGRAKFDFTVTDREGSSGKQTCALLVCEP